MPNLAEIRSCVETIELTQDMERRAALATVRLGDVVVRGVAVWRGGNGHLRVYFPGYKHGAFYTDAILLSEDMRTQVEADVISAYKAAKSEAEKSDN